MTPLPTPAPAAVDAWARAARTFAQGLVVDVVGAVATTAAAELVSPGFAFSRAYWTLLGALLAKTALTAAVSYVARHVKPPATG